MYACICMYVYLCMHSILHYIYIYAHIHSHLFIHVSYVYPHMYKYSYLHILEKAAYFPDEDTPDATQVMKGRHMEILSQVNFKLDAGADFGCSC